MNIKELNFNEKKIIVVGTIFVDIKGYPEGLFIPNGRNAGRIEYKNGGVARNVAEDLTGLGCKPVFISLTDTQGPGAGIAAQLQEAGVDTSYTKAVKDGIGTWMVILTPEGDVCANLSKRQDLLPLCEVLDVHGDEAFRDASAVLLEMDIEEEIVERVFKLAAKYGIDVYGVISNMTIALERIEYIRKTRCFICNRQEAGQFFDQNTMALSVDEMQELLRNNLPDAGINCMIVTMDKDGAVFAEIDSAENNVITGYCQAIETSVVDSTGAGDSFFAGVSAALVNGCSLLEACQIGTQMASEVIQSTENVYRR